MDVGGEVVEGEAEPDSDVRVVEARKRFKSWAETFGSTAVDRDLIKVSEDQPFMESRLPMALTRPDLYERQRSGGRDWSVHRRRDMELTHWTSRAFEPAPP